MVGLLDLRVCGQSDKSPNTTLLSATVRGVFGDLRISHFLESGEEDSLCG